ncbi:MAG: hypothetical protein NWE89_05225 [Candidatus Bathyarchaeota archaeon]|nr:hypothetical protein [Candidatus Bathyarchaeota archaeon]
MIESYVTSIVEARAALPLDGGVKCRQRRMCEPKPRHPDDLGAIHAEERGACGMWRGRSLRQVAFTETPKGHQVIRISNAGEKYPLYIDKFGFKEEVER